MESTLPGGFQILKLAAAVRRGASGVARHITGGETGDGSVRRWTGGVGAGMSVLSGRLTLPLSNTQDMIQHTLRIRVRYAEVDQMGFLHHSRYLQYFEMGRVELLRSMGHSYADLERQGVFFVVVKVECRFKAPARYDEELELTTRVVRRTHVRIDHAYELKRGAVLLAEASTTIACVDRHGKLTQIPENLR